MLSFGFSKRIFFPLFFFSLWNIVAAFLVDTFFRYTKANEQATIKDYSRTVFFMFFASLSNEFFLLYSTSQCSATHTEIWVGIATCFKRPSEPKKGAKTLLWGIYRIYMSMLHIPFVLVLVPIFYVCVCAQRFTFSCSCYCYRHQFSSISNSWAASMKFSFGNNNVIDSLLFVALVAHSVAVRPFTGQRHSFFSLFFLLTRVRLLWICLEEISGIEKSHESSTKRRKEKNIVDHMIFVVVHRVCLWFFCSPST